jgi:hypothetical protein
MQRWQYYKYAFLVTAPLAIIGYFWNIWGLVYAGVFFGFSLWLLIERQLPQEYSNSSASTHYEYGSRFNTHNYAFAGLLVAASLFISISPLPISVGVFLSWTTVMVYQQIFLPRFLTQHTQNLIAEYLQGQIPSLSSHEAHSLVELFSTDEAQSLTNWSVSMKIKKEVVEKAFKLYERYLRRMIELSDDTLEL